MRFRASKSLFDANLSAAVDVDKLDLPDFVVPCVELAAQCSALSYCLMLLNSDEVRCQIRCELPYPDELEEVPLEQGDFERVRTLHS